MKNIHIIQTDKSSRLYLGNNGNFVFGMIQTSIQSRNDDFTNQNIYITSDEEIKVGDWYINTFVSEREQKPQTHTEKIHLINHQKDYRFKYCKKIILTTDFRLAPDVQKIDDEFLEWFVKNSSCEFVEVRMNQGRYFDYGGNVHITNAYKIIIPKKNFYCGDKFDYDEQCLEQCDTCVDKKGVDYGYLPKEEPKKVLTEEDIFNQRDIDAVTDYINKEQQKQALINMMKSDEELGLYGEVYSKQGIALTSDYIQNIEKEIKLEEVFNDEKKENIKKFIDEIKNPSEPNQALKDAAHRYEKYSERFDNDKSAIGNPQTWGKRLICKDCNESLEDCTCIQDTVEFPKQGTTIEEVAEKLKGRELFKESNDRARKTLSEIKSLPIQETLEDKLKELVLEWQKRQEKYYDIAYENVDNVHTNRKFTYKAMATRDCWKELLKLIENEK